MSGAGPQPMALGPFAFHALGFGFTDVSRQLDTAWAELATTARLDALHWTGPKSDAVTIRGVIFPEEWGGLGTLEGLRKAALSGLPLMLVTRAGQIGGLHVIQSIGEERTLHDAAGRPRRDAYSIDIKRYAPSGAGGFVGSLVRLF